MNVVKPVNSREIRLKSRPVGLPTLENFEIAQVEVPNAAEGEVIVQNLWMSVDPYMRGRMNAGKSYISPFEIGQVLEGTAIGRVIASRTPKYNVGDYVTSMLGWREAFVVNESEVQPLTEVKSTSEIPLEAYLSVLGVAGLTGYTALFQIGNLKPGERVLISGASGTVGSVAAAFAKAAGCYVVGTAGNETKRKWLEAELGVDVALNYRAENFERSITQAFPEGIDIYLDNAGGHQLRIALDHMNDYGRIICSGMIDQYNDVAPRPGPSNLYNIVTRKLRVEGFIVLDHFDLTQPFQQAATQLIQSGALKWQHTIASGITAAPQALIDLNNGQSFGKSLVQIATG